MKHFLSENLQDLSHIAQPEPQQECPAVSDAGASCTCRYQARIYCRLERGLISWKDLSFPELLCLGNRHPGHPALPDAKRARVFGQYWERIRTREAYAHKGWKTVYTNLLPSRNTLLREERLPHVGQYATMDENNKIEERINAERFVLMQMAYLPLDRKGRFDVLVIDVDCNFDLNLLKTAGLPMPRYFVSRRQEAVDPPSFLRRPHLVYWLRTPVKRSMNGGQTKAELFYHAIRKTLIMRLQDLGLTVDRKLIDLSKNPHADNWDHVQGDYRDWSLDELHEAVGPLEPAKKYYRRAPSKPNTSTSGAQSNNFIKSLPAPPGAHLSQDEQLLEGYAGRNQFVFDRTRLAAYKKKKRNPESFDMRAWIETLAHQLNQDQFAQFSKGPLPRSEVNVIVNSVSKFVIHVYAPSGDGKDRGACHRANLVDAGMTQSFKQGVGGRYGARKNAEQTRQRVLDALETLGRHEGQPTITAVSKQAGISRPTARKWITQIAVEQLQNTDQAVENTVPIRKGDKKHVSAQQWINLERAYGVSTFGPALGLIEVLVDTADFIAALGPANLPYQPLRKRGHGPDSDKVYRHPFNARLVLTQEGEAIGAHNVAAGIHALERAPITVLDRGGFLDDPADEYAPPIGETDHDGSVRYSEDYFAPTRAGLATKEWSDEDVDKYFGDVLSA
jgi:transposase-like protein